MEKYILFLLFIYMLAFIPITIYLDNIFSKKTDYNIFTKIFLFIVTVFGNPLSVIIAFLIAGRFFEGLTIFDKGITTMPRIILFILIATVVSAVRYSIWCENDNIKMTKNNLLLFLRKNAYQAPFLLFTIGFFQYWNGELQVPGISLWILIFGMLYTFLFSFKKNHRSL